MNQIIINRVIGSVVLGLVSITVLPRLLSPEPSDFSMHGVEVVVNGQRSVNTSQQSNQQPSSGVEIDALPPLELQSLASSDEAEVVENESSHNQPSADAGSNLVPVKLESVAAVSPQTQSLTADDRGDKTSWIRVGSYADLKNADRLAKEYRDRKLPVKIEEVQISGVAYKRVLIGPFTDKEKLQKVMKVIQQEGHSPAVQYQ